MGGEIIGGGMPIGGEVISGGVPMGGEVISGGMPMGGEIVSGGIPMDGAIYGGSMEGVNLAPGEQVISWEGGSPIQGTVVSDVVIEGGEAATDGSGEQVDVVEPPAAGEEESPGPDNGDEETEGET